MGEFQNKAIAAQQWGTNGLPNGQPQATWYDKHGRSFVLPVDSYSLQHYQGRGLTLHPPESPEPLVEDNDWSEGSVNATRGGPRLVESPEDLPPDGVEALGGLPSAEEPRRKRGPDKKPRKSRKKRRKRA